MKVAIVTPRYPPTYAGGGEISAQLLAEQLRARGDVDAIDVLSFDGTRTESVNGVPVQRLADVPQYPYTLPNVIAYRKLRDRASDFDVLHAYNMHLHPAVGRLSGTHDVPAVATLNAYPLVNWAEIGVNPSLQRRLYERTLLRLERPLLLRSMRNIDAFLPLSAAVERVYRRWGLDGSTFEVVPNMIDPSFTVPEREGGDSARVRVLYVGYLRDSKGVRHLVDAMERLPSTYVLKIVGDGPKRTELADRASRSEASDRITFAGKVPYEEVTRAYAAADVFVHPGVWPEPFGRTILEAMQAGLPVVATDVGGPSETVPQAELRCQPADPDGLSESIVAAAERRDEIGAENRRLVETEYHPDTVVRRIVDVYRNVG